MPRQARLDAPGVLHHVMVRGLERLPIFPDDADRHDFWARIGALVAATGLTVYAWALLPNHTHLLLRTGRRPLARCMRSLLTGYAGTFNRRHKRVGHLFQNRYKSYPGPAVAAHVGVRPPAVSRAAQSRQATRGRWDRLLRVGGTEGIIRKQRPG